MVAKTRVLVLGMLFCALLCCSGCLSSLFGRSAGGRLVWWCDRCQSEVASPETHVCGMTVYDPATGRDIRKVGVTAEALEGAQKAARASGAVKRKAVSGAEDTHATWRFWQQSRSRETGPAPAARPASTKRWWRFWQ
ncbi:MAG: hypothetical protein V1918_09385 [Planctomycetota bacterium]